MCAVLGIVMLTAVLLVSERSLILEERKASVQQSVETANGVSRRIGATKKKRAA